MIYTALRRHYDFFRRYERAEVLANESQASRNYVHTLQLRLISDNHHSEGNVYAGYDKKAPQRDARDTMLSVRKVRLLRKVVMFDVLGKFSNGRREFWK